MVDVELHNAGKVDDDTWLGLQDIQRQAFETTLDRNYEEIKALVEWGDPYRFIASHKDPNTEVGRKFNPDQDFSHPVVAVARANGEPVGFATAARNVSDPDERIRQLKHFSIFKNYLWFREVAVLPEFQRQGVAKKLGRKILSHAIPLQPVTAYIWPDEMDFVQSALSKLGFNPTGEQLVDVFSGGEPVRQVRMKAPTAFGVYRKLRKS